MGFMRHPFFLSCLCHCVHEHWANSPKCLWLCSWGWEPWPKCPGPHLLPGAVSCKLLVWIKRKCHPKGMEQRRRCGGKEIFMALVNSWSATGWYPELELAFSKGCLKRSWSLPAGELSFRWDTNVAAQSPPWGCSVSYPISGCAIPVLPVLDLISLYLWKCPALEHSIVPTTARDLFEMKSIFLHHGFSAYIWSQCLTFETLEFPVAQNSLKENKDS